MQSHRKLEVLKLAFYDDPLIQYIAPSPKVRNLWLHVSMGFLLDQAKYSGELFTLDSPNFPGSPEAVLGVFAPGKYPVPRSIFLRLAGSHTTGGLMKGIPLSSVGTALKLNQKLSKLHPREKYWYISILGVDPRSQGQGCGTRLLTPVLERARREGVISYLETANPKNLPFYERLGFRVLEELEILRGAPPVWRMATSLG